MRDLSPQWEPSFKFLNLQSKKSQIFSRVRAIFGILTVREFPKLYLSMGCIALLSYTKNYKKMHKHQKILYGLLSTIFHRLQLKAVGSRYHMCYEGRNRYKDNAGTVEGTHIDLPQIFQKSILRPATRDEEILRLLQ